MTKVFDKNYADQYDLLYQDKDYEAECNLLEKLFNQYGESKINTILDLGCGTGNHAFPLSMRGYDITGVDCSRDMLLYANKKSKEFVNSESPHRKQPIFIENDICSFRIDQKYDAVIMMFAVLGYQLENSRIIQALSTVQSHLKPGGLFIFDVWYGPAVLKFRPSDRIKTVPLENGQLIRSASGSLDTYRQLAFVNYHLWNIQNNYVISESKEEHIMRYFFVQELKFFHQQTGLNLLNLSAFPSLDKEISEETWNIIGISKPI